ncbi:MAG: helix-turn-helix transcriptional regulator [Chloroflexi bacterium]|nr:helix-turn-helix transcriptional regulator [Chloroflexota bacterium]MBL7162613.1 helix-turn-helix transcriptional regulator [Anaerolineales bacterium]
MTIESQFRKLLKQKELDENRDISLKDVERETNIPWRSLLNWRDGTFKQYPADALETLCIYFDCQPGDLLVYTETEPAE